MNITSIRLGAYLPRVHVGFFLIRRVDFYSNGRQIGLSLLVSAISEQNFYLCRYKFHHLIQIEPILEAL